MMDVPVSTSEMELVSAANSTKMKKMSFAWRDLIAFLIFAAFVTVIFLDKYLWGGVDQYIVQAFQSLIG